MKHSNCVKSSKSVNNLLELINISTIEHRSVVLTKFKKTLSGELKRKLRTGKK